MVYRNPYQGYSDQEYGYTDDDHLKGHYGRYNGQAGHTNHGQYAQEEYIHQNGYSTQVLSISTYNTNTSQLKTMTGFVLALSAVLLLISRHRGPVIAMTMNLSPERPRLKEEDCVQFSFYPSMLALISQNLTGLAGM